MYLSEKNIQYADLFMAFIQCPFDKADDDCPFEKYWKISNIEEQLTILQELPANELTTAHGSKASSGLQLLLDAPAPPRLFRTAEYQKS